MTIEIEETVLKKACTEMIETIFFCLPDAIKGTVYRVGRVPELVVERVTSGVIDGERKTIAWGLPSISEYNPPGKPWKEYRDEAGRPLEAMGWCVERQKSWTAEDPTRDARSVSLQAHLGYEDFHHLEPVLVRKSDLNLDIDTPMEYPRNSSGNVIWRDSEYIVVAVIKIHFLPYTIKIDSDKTRLIKKLSRSLGTELLSYQLRQDSMKAMQAIAKDRLNACNYLADSLRNAITKSGMILSLIKQEIRYLREQWEQLLLEHFNEEDHKVKCFSKLNEILADIDEMDGNVRERIKNAHDKYIELSLPPGKGKRWVTMQIESQWNNVIDQVSIENEKKDEILYNIHELKKYLYFGQDDEVLQQYDQIPETLKREWVSLIYEDNESFNTISLDKLIGILDDPYLNIPSKKRSKNNLIKLKALAETMSQLESNTNFLLHHVLNGDYRKGSDENPPQFIKQSL
ncbi:MAG: hypothetical protein JW882_09225 [Deltaproteobacteria bacterium]|nr:hypothetical protein [Deltaproteobacteria bacterium]